ncbi:hypothetical protein [Marinilabilia sp.]|uniref:hypothetical protein n=1 Tax=Marinilabilia sp. TaxID=2021252 RepID=UPI0025C59F36|nr:hypothetical protein [Marinilabilia sp.]
MGKTNTNMASEFWFYSQLHRLGYQSYITLGNTKSIDITVQLSDETLLTFDVKGKATFNSGTYQYLPKINRENHYFVFVGLQVKKSNDLILFEGEPECYILHSIHLNQIAFNWTASNKKTKGYGFDQNIFRIIKKYDSENDVMTKTEKRKLNGFKHVHNIQNFDFKHYKSIVLDIADFEKKYYNKK